MKTTNTHRIVAALEQRGESYAFIAGYLQSTLSALERDAEYQELTSTRFMNLLRSEAALQERSAQQYKDTQAFFFDSCARQSSVYDAFRSREALIKARKKEGAL